MRNLLRCLLFAALLALIPTISHAQALFATGSITTTGTDCSTATNCVQYQFGQLTGNLSWISITVSGTFSGTLQFEGTADGSHIGSLACTTLAAGTGSSVVTSTTGAGIWQCRVSGLSLARVRASALASGTAVVQITGSYQ